MTSVPTIVYQDDALMIINKPSGWIVNDSQTAKMQPTIQGWVRENFKYPLSGNKVFRDGVVHRLDKETSGILILAKTESAFTNLQSQFKNRSVEKTYVCLVHGMLEREGVVDVAIGRLPWKRTRFGVVPGGRNSLTKYRPLNHFADKKGDKYTLVEAHPKTGRTHQIRVHMKHLGHPVVSDSFYSGRKTSRQSRLFLNRLFLHAQSIEFEHPGTKKRVYFEAKLTKDLNDFINTLEMIKS